VRGWAGSGVGESFALDSVVHVRLVIGAVEVLTIPASRIWLDFVPKPGALLTQESGEW
jgi:hypothetical protein